MVPKKEHTHFCNERDEKQFRCRKTLQVHKEESYRFRQKNHNVYGPLSVLRENTAIDLSKSEDVFPG